MLRALMTAALGLLTIGLAAQPAAPSPARVTQGPDFSGLLADIQAARQWRASLPAQGAHFGSLQPAWGVYPTIYTQPDIYPIVDPMSEYEVATIPAMTLEPEIPPTEEELLAMAWVININTASAEALAQVPLIDPLRARAIVAHRAANGPFAAPGEILEVFGITDPIFQVLAPHLVCRGATTHPMVGDPRPPSLASQPLGEPTK